MQLASSCCLSKRSAVGTGILVLVEIEGGSFLVVIAVVGLRELVRGSDDGKLIQAVNESGLVGCHGWVLCRQELAWWFVATCVAKLSSQTSYQQNGAGK